MPWIQTPLFIGYFGNHQDNLKDATDFSAGRIVAVRDKMAAHTQPLTQLIFLKQTHSTDVFCLENPAQIQSPIDFFQREGDAIITQQKHIGIGVVTADCLPVFLVDAKHEAIGVVHAGWKGLTTKVITHTILAMQKDFQTNPAELQVYLGPSGAVCCYEVQTDFLSSFPGDVFEKEIVVKRQGHHYFDQKKCALDELNTINVHFSAINTEHHCCTICTPGYCSVRQQKDDAGRQPSVVFLR